MITVLVKRKDNGISITSIHKEKSLEDYLSYYPDKDEATDNDLATFEVAKSEKILGLETTPKDLSWEIIEQSDIPNDRYFRNAWVADNGAINVDMVKARELHMEVIRGKRDKKLKELDIETLRGRDVQVEKQVLRDIPKTIDLTKATTPETLKTLLPKELM